MAGWVGRSMGDLHTSCLRVALSPVISACAVTSSVHDLLPDQCLISHVTSAW